jgi:MFS family permease
VLLCVSVPSFIINLDSNIVSVSLPSIARSLGAGFGGIEWIISAYTLTFASLVLPSGALADRYGRKRMLIVGLAVFTSASFVCGAAPNVAVLNAARAVQGAGAALQLSAALATLSHAFRGPARARAFAFWGSVLGIAVSLGPIGAAMIALTLYALGESRDPDARRIDVPGFLSFSAFLFLTTLALIPGNRPGWGSLPIRLELAAAALLFALFVTVEAVQERPMLDLRFFVRPTNLGANIASVAFAAALLPMAVPLFLVPRLVASHLTHRLPGRALLTTGLALIGAGLLWMGLDAPRFDYAAMLGGILLAGIGVGFAALGAVLFSRVSASVSAAFPGGDAAARAGFARRIAAGDLSGGAIGVGARAARHAFAVASFGEGYKAVLLVAAALAGVATLLTWGLVHPAETAPLPREAGGLWPRCRRSSSGV